jgi:hypothetical protein
VEEITRFLLFNMKITSRSYLSAALLAALALTAHADVVETKSGAKLIGKVSKIDGTSVVLTTDYAGAITIKQSEVARVQTDEPIVVRLAGGTVMAGTVTPTADGKITIQGSDGTITTSVDKVAATWAPGAKDPAIAALESKWKYEAAGDITGKSGNSDQFGTAISARAVLKGANDKLQFYTGYNRQKTDGNVSSDQFKAGTDYSNNFSGRKSWYARDEAGFDKVKDIEVYNIAGAGLGYDFIQKPHQLLTGRAGLSFRYEGYKNPVTTDVKSLGLDFGLAHDYKFGDSRLVNTLTFVPAFDDFANFRANHESYYEIPLASTAWKLRLGVSNDYNSQPGSGVTKMDTTYFTRFVLNWD